MWTQKEFFFKKIILLIILISNNDQNIPNKKIKNIYKEISLN